MSHSDLDDRAPCPFCAEPIKPLASKCRYCKEYLSEGWAGSPPTRSDATAPGVRYALAPLSVPTQHASASASPTVSGVEKDSPYDYHASIVKSIEETQKPIRFQPDSLLLDTNRGGMTPAQGVAILAGVLVVVMAVFASDWKANRVRLSRQWCLMITEQSVDGYCRSTERGAGQGLAAYQQRMRDDQRTAERERADAIRGANEARVASQTSRASSDIAAAPFDEARCRADAINGELNNGDGRAHTADEIAGVERGAAMACSETGQAALRGAAEAGEIARDVGYQMKQGAGIVRELIRRPR